MTKPLHEDALKAPIGIDDCKVEMTQKMLNNVMLIGGDEIVCKPKAKVKPRMAKSKAPVKRISKLSKATASLYDLENTHSPEKPLNIDFGLYQMEEY